MAQNKVTWQTEVQIGEGSCQVEATVFWDDKPHGNEHVLVATPSPEGSRFLKLRKHDLTLSFVMRPDGTLVYDYDS